VSGVALTLLLAGCGSHHDSRPGSAVSQGSAPTASRSFTHVVRDGGCNRHVAPIHLAPLIPPSQQPGPSGPTALRIHTHHHAPPQIPGFPFFPRRLGALPYRGFMRTDGGPEGVFYAKRPVDGRTFDAVLMHGGLVVSAAAGFSPNRPHFLARLPESLTRVRIGPSRGWINRTMDTVTGTHVLFRNVLWLSRGGVFMGLDGDRSPARLVSVARSLVC
jgi:hypothetical protein